MDVVLLSFEIIENPSERIRFWIASCSMYGCGFFFVCVIVCLFISNSLPFYIHLVPPNRFSTFGIFYQNTNTNSTN